MQLLLTKREKLCTRDHYSSTEGQNASFPTLYPFSICNTVTVNDVKQIGIISDLVDQVMAARKTRVTLTTHTTTLVASGRELIPSQLPTNRDVLRLGIYLRETAETDTRNYPVNILVRDIVPVLFAQWTKANAEFKFPVTIHNKALGG